MPATTPFTTATQNEPPRPPSPNTLSAPYPHPFLDAEELDVWEEDLMCLTELRMVLLSASIREKEKWWEKYRSKEIRDKWREEALAQEIEVLEVSRRLSEQAVDWVLRELEEYDAMRTGEGIEVSCADNIYQSDTLIQFPLRSSFLSALKVLEDIPDTEKDWHPRSNHQVLDIVHPSLYPIVYGKTLHWPSSVPLSERNGGTLRPVEPPVLKPPAEDQTTYGEGDPTYSLSQNFAWLPTPFEISTDGQSCRIASYINNLHPKQHADMYACIALTFPLFIPLFERVLSDLKEGMKRRIKVMSYTTIWNTEDGTKPTFDSNMEYEQFWQIEEKAIEESEVIPSDVPAEYPPHGIASIHLTPENPTYEGGKWHVEGMRNERIVATGIWRTDRPHHEQADEKGCIHNWGFTANAPLNQPIGSVHTKAGRCIAFPNLYQHCVSSFSLLDPSKPGHRKIVVFFLSDPNLTGDEEVLDTSQVPPQQKEWYTRELEALPLDSALKQLPNELLAKVGESIDGLFTLEETKEDRLKLMDERSTFITESDEKFFQVDFNMCEH
ncbi:hypothetical protein BT69DRAFT_1338461 [Atractiella rhizophila]|nr:hypothetical protein BT69DRAFT_1338461 [Atractiella rhizophila]